MSRIAASSAFAENEPLGDAGTKPVRFGVKARSAIFRYAPIHSSTVMPSRPSMMAMILQRSAWVRRAVDDDGKTAIMAYPPVLVPPMISKRSHGRGTLFSPSAARMRSIRCSRMSRLDSPRIPPPSEESLLARSQTRLITPLTQRKNADSIADDGWIHYNLIDVARSDPFLVHLMLRVTRVRGDEMTRTSLVGRNVT